MDGSEKGSEQASLSIKQQIQNGKPVMTHVDVCKQNLVFRVSTLQVVSLPNIKHSRLMQLSSKQ